MMTSQTNCGIIKNVTYTAESIILADSIKPITRSPLPTVKGNVRISNKANEKLPVDKRSMF